MFSNFSKIKYLSLLVVILLAICGSLRTAEQHRPNAVLIVCDDLNAVLKSGRMQSLKQPQIRSIRK